MGEIAPALEAMGRLLGKETRAKGARVLLAPTVNLHRTPVGGRNFECQTEDPYLSSRLTVGYINGLQSEGVSACVKHFVGNDTEFERMTIDSQIDERTYAVVSVNAFDGVDPSLLRHATASFDGEGKDSRLLRRQRNWIADVQFTVDQAGWLSDRRIFADLGRRQPFGRIDMGNAGDGDVFVMHGCP